MPQAEPGRQWEIKWTSIEMGSDGILVVNHHQGENLDIEVFRQQAAVFAEAFPEERGYVLFFLNRCRATPDGRKFGASAESTANMRAGALVVESKFGAMMGNFFMRVNKPPILVQIFTDEQAAKAWLLEHMEADGYRPYA